MAAKYIKEMQKADPYGPYTLGGYSFGANVVYEMASQLKANGFEISKLIIFDAYEPHRIIGHVPLPGLTTDNYEQNLCKMADIFASLYGKELKLPTSVLEGISREEQFHLLHKELSAIGVEVTPEQVKGFMEVCFANISCSYAPENNELLNVPVVVIKPEGRVKEENSWGLGKPMEKDSMGWQSITNETVKVYNVSGDHWTFLNPPHVQQVAEYLKEELSIEGKKIALSM